MSPIAIKYKKRINKIFKISLKANKLKNSLIKRTILIVLRHFTIHNKKMLNDWI